MKMTSNESTLMSNYNMADILTPAELDELLEGLDWGDEDDADE